MPQNKQTDCGTNEAFSATLRTCVPIIPSENSFINISSFTPSYNISAFKGNENNIYLAVGISNPYNQAFTLNWRRNYNGFDTAYLDDDSVAANRNFTPASFSTQVGAHIITVQVLNSQNQVVDSHSWTITLTEAPTPFLSNGIPNVGAIPALTTISPVVNFQVTANNNNAPPSGGTRKITWYLNSTNEQVFPIPDAPASGTFTNVYTFDPSVHGTGLFLLRAVLSDSVNTYAEQSWAFNVSYPALPKINLVQLINGSPLGYTTTVKSYHGLYYTDASIRQNPTPAPTQFINFAPVGQSSKADFCVQIADGRGVYTTDTDTVRIDFYKDGISLICSAMTTGTLNEKICLSSVPACTGALSSLAFHNTNPQQSQAHTISVRVTDVASNQEYTSNDTVGLLPYPITFNVLTGPINEAPGIIFETTNANPGIVCSSSSGSVRNGCGIISDTTYNFKAEISSDDFYFGDYLGIPFNPSYFSCSYRLLKSNAQIATGSCPVNASKVCDCSVTVPSFDANGPVDVTIPNTYSVVVSAEDIGSEIIGSLPKASNTLTWKLSVGEYQSAPTLGTIQFRNSSNGVITQAVEGDTIKFEIPVTDLERDNYKIHYYNCKTDINCTGVTIPFVTQPVTRGNNNNPYTGAYQSFLLPEDIVGDVGNTDTPQTVYFKIVVEDLPFTEPNGNSSTTVSFNVINKNPEPVLGGTSTPAIGSTLRVPVGYALSINPGTVTDLSTVASESALNYQWYASQNGSTNYQQITGAKTKNLTWIPSETYASGTIYLRLCINDGSAVYPLPANGASIPAPAPVAHPLAAPVAVCSANYQVDVTNNTAALDLTGLPAIGTYPAEPVGLNRVPSEGAVWQDNTTNLDGTSNSNVSYVAFITSANADGSGARQINVSKIVRDTTTDQINTTSFKTIVFDPIEDVVVGDPTVASSISIAGTGESLYVAYICRPATSLGNKACIRRIEKNWSSTQQKSALPHGGPFGFKYSTSTPYVLLRESTNSGSFTISNSSSAANHLIEADNTAGAWIYVNGYGIHSDLGLDDSGLAAGGNNFCELGGCTTTLRAQGLRNYINANTNSRIQGFTANITTPGVVNLYGMKGNDQWNSSSVVAGIGKITVQGGQWFLPAINASLPGADQHKISVFHNTDGYMGVLTENKIDLTSYDRALELTNDNNGSNMYIALKSAEPGNVGQLKIIHVSLAGPNGVTQSPYLMSSHIVDQLSISAPKASNNYIYVSAKIGSGDFMVGRYLPATLTADPGAENTLLHFTDGFDNAEAIAGTNIFNAKIVASPGITKHAILFVTAKLPLATNYEHYALKFSNAISSTETIHCAEDLVPGFTGGCTPVTKNHAGATGSKLFVSSPESGVALGSVPPSPGIASGDLVHTLSFGLGTNPEYSYLNITPLAASPTTRSANGWRPPFVR